MKKTLLFVALVTIITSCKKDYPALPTLNGTWELTSVTGGFGPTVVPAEKKDKYVITINSKYTKIDANNIETKGNYIVKFDEENNGFKFGTITFSNPAYTDAFAFKADTIIIGSSASDGPSYKYVRIKK
ncbi:hypothetical protein [Mucilaginibacter phyllosphaerae]